MITKVQEYRLENGKTLRDYLESKYSNFKSGWTAKDNIVVFMVYIEGLRSPKIFRWEVEDDAIHATNGGSISLTPELNKGIQELEKRKSTVQVELLRIYNFVKQYHLEEDQPINLVLDKASIEFKLSQGEIEEIYIKVDNILYGKPLV